MPPTNEDRDPHIHPDVPGFPHCGSCRFLVAGPPAQCAWCAHRSIQAVAPAGHCRVCCQVLAPGRSCDNRLCYHPDRAFGWASAIAMKSGPLERVLIDYKYHGAHVWRLIFARLLLGHLEHLPEFARADLIVAAPTWSGPPDHRFPHTEAVLEAAATEDTLGRWPFDVEEPRSITVIGPRPSSAGGGYAAKQETARRLTSLLLVPDPGRVRGRRILVYDDVLTTGHTLDAIAGVLRAAGAVEVNGIVLARQPWQW